MTPGAVVPEAGKVRSAPWERWGLRVVGLAALLVWLAVSLPLAMGERTLFYRDVFSIHLPMKAFGAAELAAGRIPAFNPAWGLGQPFRGNPQALAFYPGNVLYLMLPFWSAFNLHYALHWLLALVTMAALARELGVGPAGALLAGITYAGSGWMLSALSFYHIVAVSAWWPLVLLGGARGGRRGIAIGGLACGMALLGGEPLLAALGIVPLLAVALARQGALRGLLTTLAIGGLGLLVALPQVVATARTLPFTFRGAHGVPAGQVGLYALAPVRLVELLLPLPFGEPGDLGSAGLWLLPRVPLVFTLHVGLVGLCLAGAALGRREVSGPRDRLAPALALLAVTGLLLAGLGGPAGGLLLALSAGLFRYPEKLLFWFALALPLLAGLGLDRVLVRPRGWSRAVAWSGAAAVGLAVASLAGGRFLSRGLVARLPAGSPPGVAETRVALLVLALLAAGILLGLAGWLSRRGSGAGLAGLQLLALLQLAPLVMTDATSPYHEPGGWARRLEPGTAVVSASVSSPFRERAARYPAADTSVAAQQRLAALDLDPAPGALHGFTYPLAPDPDGFASPLFTLMLYNLPRLGWAERARLMRGLGVEVVVLVEAPGVPELARIDSAVRAGVPVGLYRVQDPAPAVWWPDEVAAVESPAAALVATARGGDPSDRAVVSRPVRHDPSGTARLIAAAPDRLVIETAGGGGVAVLRRAYQPLFRARTEGPGGERELPTLPVDLNLMGVEVPPGRQRVVLEVSARPEVLAAVVAALAMVSGFALLLSGRPRGGLRSRGRETPRRLRSRGWRW